MDGDLVGVPTEDARNWAICTLRARSADGSRRWLSYLFPGPAGGRAVLRSARRNASMAWWVPGLSAWRCVLTAGAAVRIIRPCRWPRRSWPSRPSAQWPLGGGGALAPAPRICSRGFLEPPRPVLT